MSLTEEEKSLIAIFRGSEYHQDKVVVDLVDRLLAENEELKKNIDNFGPFYFRDMNRVLELGENNNSLDKQMKAVQALQAQLDAIKKAAGPICALIPIEVRNLKDVGDSNYVNAKIGDLKALDKLIGGEE